MPNVKLELGQRIKAARVNARLTQRQLAQLAKLSKDAQTAQTRVSQWELGKRLVNHDELAKLARALNVPLATLGAPLFAAYGLSLAPSRSLPVLDWKTLMAKRRPVTRRLSVVWPNEISKSAFVLPVMDDNCAPHMMRGQFIVVDPTERPRHGGMVIAACGERPPIACHVRKARGKHAFDFQPMDGSGTFSSINPLTTLIGVITDQIISRR